MDWTIIVAVFLLGLLVTEWYTSSRFVHVLAVVAATALFLFCQPLPYRALRRAVSTMEPVKENLWVDRPATEFESGLFTMYNAILDDIAMDAGVRHVSLGVLVWLTLSPAFWRRRRDSPPRVTAGDGVPSRAA